MRCGSNNHFCSALCRNRFNNRIKNPTLWAKKGKKIKEIKEKTQRKPRTYSMNTYEKRNGRHLHRTVAEQKLGRPLRKGEVVHHIDENKRNNDPDNLIVFSSQREHALHHESIRRKKREEVMPYHIQGA